MQLIKSVFPKVEWTGESSLHCSLARGVSLPPVSNPAVISMLQRAKVARSIWNMLQKLFPGMEWIINGEEFENFLLVDCWRHLRCLGDSDSDKKLINPSTGNRFHRIAMGQNLVCGIRFWCDRHSESSPPAFGFRFRVQMQDEDDDKTRTRTRATCEAMEEAMNPINAEILQLAEPPKEVVQEFAATLEPVYHHNMGGNHVVEE